MSEPLAERLSRFTPAGLGLDRDALLFAAGRASVRTSRRWQASAAALAACQLLTLVCLWPRTPAPMPTAPSLASHPAMDAMPEEEPVPVPPRQEMLRAGLLSMDLDKPEPPSAEPMAPPEPPLRVLGTPPATILN